MRPLFCVLVAMLAVSASAAAANPVTATLSTSSTQPLAETPWRYTITVKDQSGKGLAAKARLQILLGPLVVGCWKGTAIAPCSGATAGTWIAFIGKRSATIRWPAQTAGTRLTFRATVVTGTRILRLQAPVTVQPEP